MDLQEIKAAMQVIHDCEEQVLTIIDDMGFYPKAGRGVYYNAETVWDKDSLEVYINESSQCGEATHFSACFTAEQLASEDAIRKHLQQIIDDKIKEEEAAKKRTEERKEKYELEQLATLQAKYGVTNG